MSINIFDEYYKKRREAEERDFRHRVSLVTTKALERYKGVIERRGFFDTISYIFDDQRITRLNVVKEVLERRKNPVNPYRAVRQFERMMSPGFRVDSR